MAQLSALLLFTILAFRLTTGSIIILKDYALLAFALYGLFIFLMVLGVAGSEDIPNGLFASARSAVYLATAIALYLLLSNTAELELHRTLSTTILFAAPVFYIVFLSSAVYAGVNVPKVLFEGFATGNPNYIQFSLFNKAFNALGSADEEFSSAARHGVMVVLCTFSLANLCLAQARSAAGTFLSWSVFAVAFISLSRTITISLLIIGALFIIRNLSSKELKLRYVVLFFACVLCLAAWLLTNADSAVASVLMIKFGEDIVNNPRLFEYSQVLGLIADHAFFGWGTGTPIEFNLTGSEYPHNFILYGWHQLGIFGLLTSSAFVVVVANQVWFAFRSALFYAAQREQQLSNAFMLGASLLIFVLVRLMFAKAGLLALAEWIAFTVGMASITKAHHEAGRQMESDKLTGIGAARGLVRPRFL